MVQHGGSTQPSLCPPSRQCRVWQVCPQYMACLHLAHLFRSIGSAESCLPHPGHVQTLLAAGGGGLVVCGAADAPLGATGQCVRLPRPATSVPVAVPPTADCGVRGSAAPALCGAGMAVSGLAAM